ncbi:DUF2306 domain-containing protein [Dyadobacter arcticus]|uniref:DUF2306 domain-containing protein n=1 Tax=Dyadobacter arcticus TaxID=1078754 RepID=A0ABX0UJD7_9BACT|nr:DUF2306 domain-containing protein [Dyadobacter arcticus]NIJ52912.1 hypothetical protein [Dyadobacter arcticus]
MKPKSIRYAGWAIFLGLAFYYIHHNAIGYFDLSSTIYSNGFQYFKAFIIGHIFFGVLALLVGPFQFMPAIRIKYASVHRKLGLLYLMSVSLAGLAGGYLAIFDNIIRKKDFMFGAGALAMDLAWFVTGAMAFWAVKKRAYTQHREWMVRNYVLTSNFIIFRLIFYALLDSKHFAFQSDTGSFTVWVSWSVPLLVTELVIQAKKIDGYGRVGERKAVRA